MKKEYSVALGETTAEEVKVALGSAWPLPDEMYAEIRGRDLVTGLPKTVTVSSVEMREALEEGISSNTHLTTRHQNSQQTSWTKASCWQAEEHY